jgi:UDP-N-acetylmuramyl-tripeptide synthetase
MKLSTLTDRLAIDPHPLAGSAADPEVTAICTDSRRVTPGCLFVAIDGFAHDGHTFIADAVDNGAVAVVCRKAVDVDAVVVRVADPRAALARLACRYYGFPADRMCLIGVTGTNGKTTVTYLLERMLEKAGCRPGVVGTVNCRFAGRSIDSAVTTPESLELQALLRQMADAGVTHVVMEVSSHALDLHRVDGCRFDAAVFTNLTQDHLDHHGTMERYWACKQRLFFEHLKPVDAAHPVRAVVNIADPRGKALAERLGRGAWRSAADGGADIYPLAVNCDLAGIGGRLATPAGPIDFHTPLVGDFNVANLLSAVGAALAVGLPRAAVAAGIEAIDGVPGRLERVAGNSKRSVFVDYAHTPDALENAIAALRTLTPGRLITVFGCGGDRDPTKRPIMGAIAARLSDLAVVTSDNPRSEPPLAIIAEIEAGIRRVCSRRLSVDALKNGWRSEAYVVEPDRAAAIAAAIAAAGKDDAVLIAGKGHETYQILADETVHFDDREVARRVLAAASASGSVASC